MKESIKRYIKSKKFLFYPFKFYLDVFIPFVYRVNFHIWGYHLNNLVYKNIDFVSYFAMFGTLLGLVRDKKYIPWDCDIDYAVTINDKNEWKRVIESLEKEGFVFEHFYTENNEITEISFKYKNINCDFFKILDNEKEKCCHGYLNYENREYKTNELSIEETFFTMPESIFIQKIKGSMFYIPSNYNEILCNSYGESYMTPIKTLSESRKVSKRIFPEGSAYMHNPSELKEYL